MKDNNAKYLELMSSIPDRDHTTRWENVYWALRDHGFYAFHPTLDDTGEEPFDNKDQVWIESHNEDFSVFTLCTVDDWRASWDYPVDSDGVFHATFTFSKMF